MSILQGLPIPKYIILAIPMLLLAIFLRKYMSDDSNSNTNTDRKSLSFSIEEIAKYNGIDTNLLYLSVLGSVFDVTEGKQHYAKGSPYHYFIGKDGTRALVSGNFYDESSNKDHILDLSCNDLHTIITWKHTFKGKYKYVGTLAGRYFDENGLETVYMKELKQKLNQCKLEKEEAKKKEQIYPPCNMAWSEEDGTRVWCTKSSGGIVRNWVGVPRQLFTPGDDKPQCVCVNLEHKSTSLVKEYHGCPNTSTECFLK